METNTNAHKPTKSAFNATGPFVAMISYMLMRDLKQFSLIYLIFLYSFAQCIFFVNYELPPTSAANTGTGANATQMLASNETTAASLAASIEAIAESISWHSIRYFMIWLELFKMTLGVYELQPYRHSILSRLFLVLYLNLVPILFNM